MNYFIEPLTSRLLENATSLRDSIFPGLNALEYATLEESLKKENHDVRRKLNIIDLDYWIARDESDNVVGLIGLYTEEDDADIEVWLGWYCVDPSTRGSGIGTRLLDFAIGTAWDRGYTTLKLYTTSADEYAAARRLYEKKGFIDTTSSSRAKTRYYKLSK